MGLSEQDAYVSGDDHKKDDRDEAHGYTVVLDPISSAGRGGYRDSALPFSKGWSENYHERLPERLRQMKYLYEYGSNSPASRAENFYRQAVFMEDYEDVVPWEGRFLCYFPTYHDLTTRQLRGYFTWRSRVRRGDYQEIPISAAYLYIYELLNGVGASSPEDVLDKLSDFEAGYIDSGIGDYNMRRNLHQWMFEYAILHDLPTERIRQFAEREAAWDDTVSVLQKPLDHTDDEIFTVLLSFARKDASRSPVISQDPDRGIHLFSEAWRLGNSIEIGGRDLFSLCFGLPLTRRWYPLSTAVYYARDDRRDRDFAFSPCRSYVCRDGAWQVSSFEKQFFDRKRFQSFWRGVDAGLRRYLGTGRYLKEAPSEEWVEPLLEALIEADKRERMEASRPRINIDLGGLDRIRRDAIITRDSLLTEEEISEPLEMPEEIAAPLEPDSYEAAQDIPLDDVHAGILRALLMGQDVTVLLGSAHIMPSIFADEVNEALYDEIGDTVLICEDDRLSLIEDYLEDLEKLLGVDHDG